MLDKRSDFAQNWQIFSDKQQDVMMEKRHELILDYLKEYEEAESAELAENLGVSIETIRRDLNKLADQNKLYRTHGGAMSLQSQNIGQSFSTRKKSHNDGKKHIAELIRKHIFEDAVIVLDASSTAWYIAQRLPNIPCKIITSSMRIIHSLAHKPHIETIATGGIYSEKYDAFYGPFSEHLFSRLHIDMAIFSCTGIYEGAIWESNQLNLPFKRKVLAMSKQKFLVADHSKIERKDVFRLCDLQEVDKLFTDKPLTGEILADYQARTEVVWAI